MKALVCFLAIALVSVSSFAIEIYNCDVTATAKSGARKDPWTKKVFLSREYRTHVDFQSDWNQQTTLDLRVNYYGVFTGTVNGQESFILNGDTVKGGLFESAYHKGEIKCEAPVQVSYMVEFTPWKQFFTMDEKLSVGHILNEVDKQAIRYGYTCYIGDVNQANKAISSSAKVQGTVAGEEISYTFDVTDCVKGSGIPGDDQCEEFKTYSVTKSVENCFKNVDDR